jgi:hypothetical protein
MAEQDGERDLRDRSAGDLMKQLSDQTTTLVRQEIERRGGAVGHGQEGGLAGRRGARARVGNDMEGIDGQEDDEN